MQRFKSCLLFAIVSLSFVDHYSTAYLVCEARAGSQFSDQVLPQNITLSRFFLLNYCFSQDPSTKRRVCPCMAIFNVYHFKRFFVVAWAPSINHRISNSTTIPWCLTTTISFAPESGRTGHSPSFLIPCKW